MTSSPVASAKLDDFLARILWVFRVSGAPKRQESILCRSLRYPAGFGTLPHIPSHCPCLPQSLAAEVFTHADYPRTALGFW